MNRRGFLSRLLAAPLAAYAVGRGVPPTTISAVTVPFTTLSFHRDAFAMVQPGISMRVVRNYLIDTGAPVHRFDVLYGSAQLAPSFAIQARVSA